MSKPKKKESPSHIKYEQHHPTFSFRISKELNDRQAVKEIEEKSNTDIMKAGLGLFEVKIGQVQELRDESYQKGFTKARDLYKVSYSCTKCGKLISVNTPEEKRAIRNYMQEAGWGHTDCSKV